MKFAVLLYLVLVMVCPYVSKGQGGFNYYLSNAGNDQLPGTSPLLPKKSLAKMGPLLTSYAQQNGRVSVGFKAGEVFEGKLNSSFPISVGSYALDSSDKSIAAFNGSVVVNSGWSIVQDAINTYQHLVSLTDLDPANIAAIGNYNFISVFEVDLELEKTAPFSAIRVLQLVSSSQEVELVSGSCHVQVQGNQTALVYLHPSDGHSPNSHPRFRYEITQRDWAFNAYTSRNNRFEKLWVRGYGAGVGMLPGGENTYYEKVVFGPGAGIHHVVTHSGEINHSLFLPGAKNTTYFATVFYDAEGKQRHCSIKNSIFLDAKDAIYAHTANAGGTTYGAVEIEQVASFADLTDPGAFIFTKNNDTVLLNQVYTDGHIAGYNYGTAKFASIRNAYFKDVVFGIGFSPENAVSGVIENVYIKTKGETNVTGVFMQANTDLSLKNSIIHLRGNATNYWPRAGAFVFGAGQGNGKIQAAGNIFICEVHPSTSVLAANTNTTNGYASSKDAWDNNVYILLKGAGISWADQQFYSNDWKPNILSFADWKRQSGQDQHSLYFDLRNDPRGLKAIFVDPEQGDYTLANTPEGRQVKALKAGMTDPLTCFLQRPSYEAAAAMIQHGEALTVNTCKDPCVENAMRASESFKAIIVNKRQAQFSWNLQDYRNIVRCDLQRSEAFVPFSTVYNVPLAGSTRQNYTAAIQPNRKYQYRLALTNSTGRQCFSDVITVQSRDENKLTIFPSPSNGSINVSLNGFRGGAMVSILNALGQPVLRKTALFLGTPPLFDLQSFPAGVYFLKVETSTGNYVQNFSLN